MSAALHFVQNIAQHFTLKCILCCIHYSIKQFHVIIRSWSPEVLGKVQMKKATVTRQPAPMES